MTYLSVVSYIDEDRIALSNQFMSKTLTNLIENPQVAIRVVDPETMYEYDIDARHIGHEVSGELFDSMRTQVEAVRASPNASSADEMQDLVKRLNGSPNLGVATAIRHALRNLIEGREAETLQEVYDILKDWGVQPPPPLPTYAPGSLEDIRLVTWMAVACGPTTDQLTDDGEGSRS